MYCFEPVTAVRAACRALAAPLKKPPPNARLMELTAISRAWSCPWQHPKRSGLFDPFSELELELIQSHMSQKPVLRGEVGCACVAREVSVERGGMGEFSAQSDTSCLTLRESPPSCPDDEAHRRRHRPQKGQHGAGRSVSHVLGTAKLAVRFPLLGLVVHRHLGSEWRCLS